MKVDGYYLISAGHVTRPEKKLSEQLIDQIDSHCHQTQFQLIKKNKNKRTDWAGWGDWKSEISLVIINSL